MSLFVAPSTQTHQICSRIITKPAPRLNVVNLKTLYPAAPLAAPAVSFKDFTAELTIRFGLKL
jgi:hypothetical protein